MKKWDQLLFIEKVKENRQQFGEKIKGISYVLDIDPDWLMAIMNSESGLNHRAVNPYAGATGLIQFMPSTAQALGTNTEALKNMSNVQQLDYVAKYYAPYIGKLNSFSDLYLVTFYPKALGYPDNYVFGSEVSPERVDLIAKQNPGIDINKNGKVTMAEFKEFSLKKVPETYRSKFKKQSKGVLSLSSNSTKKIIGIVLIFISLYIFYLIYRKKIA